jgi:hypothetical protein
MTPRDDSPVTPLARTAAFGCSGPRQSEGREFAVFFQSRIAGVGAAKTIREELDMKVGTLVGLILIVLGLIGVAYGGITYTRRREVARVGPVQVTASEERTIPISPIFGGVAILAGAALIIAVRRAS